MQTGELLFTIGVIGFSLTITAEESANPVHPATVADTKYLPALADAAFVIVGFCIDDVKPFGPVQLYFARSMAEAVNSNVAPSHNGPLVDAFGAEGVSFITIILVPAVLEQPFTVTITEYVPALADMVFAKDGFCNVELKPSGPVQL